MLLTLKTLPSLNATLLPPKLNTEAVFKAISSYGSIASDGAGAPLNEIEIKSNQVGAPEVVLSGKAKDAAAKAGVKSVNVSISHSGAYSVAVALAQ
ncbi:hypothetical protein G6F36_007447 [Rhizopus arrhizus]|nr:hypothetical protein G6F36_007447 [Rhizopus arrhizus]